MVGSKERLREARAIDIGKLAQLVEPSESAHFEQIQVDLKRSVGRMPKKFDCIQNILLCWIQLNGGIGYTQGMDMICIVLYDFFRDTNSPKPEQDTLAALGFVCRVNAKFMPLHQHDKTPMKNASLFASEVWMEICSVNAVLGQKILLVLDLLEIFALRHLTVCFANLFPPDALRIVWDYLLDNSNGDEEVSRDQALHLATARCRHVVSACFLEHKKLWMYGKDGLQNFKIWETLLSSLTDDGAALHIVNVAAYLEKVERLGGHAH